MSVESGGGFEDGDVVGISQQASEQASEQAREQAAQAAQMIQRTQKDEKKAQRYDLLLAEIIEHLLQGNTHDHIITQLIPLLQLRVPSHMLAATLILVEWGFIEKGREMAQLAPLEKPLYEPTNEPIQYSEPLDTALQKYINIWFETLRIILTQDPSEIATKKFQNILKDTEKGPFIGFVSHVFGHFLFTHNIIISDTQAASYAQFIVSEIDKIVQELETTDLTEGI